MNPDYEEKVNKLKRLGWFYNTVDKVWELEEPKRRMTREMIEQMNMTAFDLEVKFLMKKNG